MSLEKAKYFLVHKDDFLKSKDKDTAEMEKFDNGRISIPDEKCSEIVRRFWSVSYTYKPQQKSNSQKGNDNHQ